MKRRSGRWKVKDTCPLMASILVWSSASCSDRPTLPEKPEPPRAAVLFVVDKSGSFAGNPMEVFKKGCADAARQLGPGDYVGVLAFDMKARWVFPFTRAAWDGRLEKALEGLSADGGSDLEAGLVESYKAFRTGIPVRSAGIKHAVVLSDGETRPADFETIVRELAAEGITVSSICVGGDTFNAPLMSRIAAWGRGRFMFVESVKKVPALLVRDLRQAIGQE